ncbi:hypothetical protein GF322_00125 [Candidatus Dependentiae bacterium]|nr:hypothetical protein [Candidatus Dependentiae bacterium]
MFCNFSKKITLLSLMIFFCNIFYANAIDPRKRETIKKIMQFFEIFDYLNSPEGKKNIKQTAGIVYLIGKNIYDAYENWDFNRKYKQKTEKSNKQSESYHSSKQSDYNSKRKDNCANQSINKLFIAAKNGDIEAQHKLAYSYYIGKIIRQDEIMAFKWWQRAAENGYAEAQFYLGLCYEKGLGVEKNLNKAFEWYKKSAEQNFDEAIKKLNSDEIVCTDSSILQERDDQEEDCEIENLRFFAQYD